MSTVLKGVGVALVTPFDDKGEVDYQMLQGLVDYVIDNGVDYLVALGTTAETPTLSDEEKRSIVVCIKERNAARVPIVLGAGDFDTMSLVKHIKESDFDGITALLSVTPYYNRPSEEGLFQHYKYVSQASPVPVLLYNVPARTGVNMSAALTLRIAHQLDNVIGIKEASGNIHQFAEIINGRPEGFLVISGDDALAIPLISIGGDGVISVAANVFPDAVTQMTHLALDQKQQEAAKYFHRLYLAMKALFEEGNPTGVKTALEIKEKLKSNVRLPLVKGSQELRDKLAKLIEKYDI